jgi:hypothetical protein
MPHDQWVMGMGRMGVQAQGRWGYGYRYDHDETTLRNAPIGVMKPPVPITPDPES